MRRRANCCLVVSDYAKARDAILGGVLTSGWYLISFIIRLSLFSPQNYTCRMLCERRQKRRVPGGKQPVTVMTVFSLSHLGAFDAVVDIATSSRPAPIKDFRFFNSE